MLFTHHSILTAADISCVVIPDGCVGLATLRRVLSSYSNREGLNAMLKLLKKYPDNKVFLKSMGAGGEQANRRPLRVGLVRERFGGLLGRRKLRKYKSRNHLW